MNIVRGFRRGRGGKVRQAGPGYALFPLANCNRFSLGLLRPGQRREKLAVPAPRRFALLASTQNPGAQTIQFEGAML